MNIYLDIDQVLITKESKPAKHVVDFLKYITDKHQVYWLTTHCKGDAEVTVQYLKDKLPVEAMPSLQKIKPTNWQTLKTEAIDFSQDFRWFDDCLMESEKKVLLDNNSLLRFNQIDLNKYPDSLKIEDYKFKENEIYVGEQFEYKMHYSAEEFEKITQGYYAPEKGMDERWRFIFSGNDLYILRSWSSWVAYKITFNELGDGYVSAEAVTYFGKTTNGQFWNNYHAKSAFLLIEAYLLDLDLWFLSSHVIDAGLKIDINGLHGFGHWKNVYKNGMTLVKKYKVDKEVIKYFAFLHDIGRENEYTDIKHGERSAKLIKQIASEIKLDAKQRSQLIEAVENHTNGNYKSDDETVMACLDSDRLDIPRVGVELDKKYLYFSNNKIKNMSKVKTIRELNKKAVYRFAKVLYIVSFVCFLALTIFQTRASLYPVEIIDNERTIITCATGEKFNPAERNVYINDIRFSSAVNFEIQRLCRYIVGNSSNYNVDFKYKTIGSLQSMNQAVVINVLLLTLLYIMIQRIFYYIYFGALFPKK